VLVACARLCMRAERYGKARAIWKTSLIHQRQRSLKSAVGKPGRPGAAKRESAAGPPAGRLACHNRPPVQSSEGSARDALSSLAGSAGGCAGTVELRNPALWVHRSQRSTRRFMVLHSYRDRLTAAGLLDPFVEMPHSL